MQASSHAHAVVPTFVQAITVGASNVHLCMAALLGQQNMLHSHSHGISISLNSFGLSEQQSTASDCCLFWARVHILISRYRGVCLTRNAFHQMVIIHPRERHGDDASLHAHTEYCCCCIITTSQWNYSLFVQRQRS